MINGIKYISYDDDSGYSNAAKGYMLGLINQGFSLTWTPMKFHYNLKSKWSAFEGTKTGDVRLDTYCNKKIDYDMVILHLTPELYPRWVAREKNKRIFGYTVWETTKMPAHWILPINMLDQLMVPCRWNKQIFEEGGVKIPIDVIPHLINQELSTHQNIFHPYDQSDYIFYTINEWSLRKAMPQLIKAYLETFTADDPTCLVIKTTAIDSSRKIRPHFLEKLIFRTRFAVRDLSKRYTSPAKIKLITKHLSNEEIHDLHIQGDCYVSLCHAEGWGLGAYDAASFGNPVIMTGYG
ncbi:MAG: glycosyltransferase [Chloroflexi bacterium]|nr:glycosyltransferase [Chloroflexota bacterium]